MIQAMYIIGIYVGIMVIAGRILRAHHPPWWNDDEGDILLLSALWPILIIAAIGDFIYFALDYLIFKRRGDDKMNVQQDFKPFCEGCPCVEPEVYTTKEYANNDPIRTTIFVTCEHINTCSSVLNHFRDHPAIWKSQFPEG